MSDHEEPIKRQIDIVDYDRRRNALLGVPTWHGAGQNRSLIGVWFLWPSFSQSLQDCSFCDSSPTKNGSHSACFVAKRGRKQMQGLNLSPLLPLRKRRGLFKCTFYGVGCRYIGIRGYRI